MAERDARPMSDEGPTGEERLERLPDHEIDDERTAGGGILGRGGTAIDRGTGAFDDGEGDLAVEQGREDDEAFLGEPGFDPRKGPPAGIRRTTTGSYGS